MGRFLFVGLVAMLLAGCGRRGPDLSPPSGRPDPGDLPRGAYEEGIASWYGEPFHGRRTANGEVYDMEKPTAAHKTLPFDTRVRVLNLDNGRSTHVRINDRGPFIEGRIIDLSRRSAREIRMIGPGTARVRLYIESGDGPPPMVRPGQSYTVQVGAFRRWENARRLRQKLARRHRDVRISQADGLYRVQVGAFASRTQAQDLARRLKRDGSVSEAVVVGF